MDLQKQACSICAWRQDCQKKFTISGRDLRCPDYARDLSIKNSNPSDEKESNEV